MWPFPTPSLSPLEDIYLQGYHKRFLGWGCYSVVEYLPSMCRALGSINSPSGNYSVLDFDEVREFTLYTVVDNKTKVTEV